MTATANPSSVCLGSNTHLSATGGCTSYQWTDPNGSLSSTTIADPFATPTATTTYSVTVTCGSCSQTLPVTVTVYPTPTAAIYQKDSTTICATSGYISYQWSGPNGLISSATDSCLQVTQSGTYSVLVTDVNGCTNQVTSPPIALPIELLDFSARVVENDVVLTWITSSEINNDYFTVEKSANRENFIEVTKVQGAGNSSSVRHYSAIDRSPYPGVSYYRLKQTDFDHKFSYSKTVAVDIDRTVGGHLNIYPNPATAQIALYTSAFQNPENMTVIVMNVLGEALLKEKLDGNNGQSSANDRFIINIRDLPAGIYFVQVFLAGTNTKWVGRFVKK